MTPRRMLAPAGGGGRGLQSMPNARSRWVEVPASQCPWEREALAVPREGLPDHEPWRAWSNLQVTAQDGSVNEVDALVVGRTGQFLIEIKGLPDHKSGRLWKLNLSEVERWIRAGGAGSEEPVKAGEGGGQ